MSQHTPAIKTPWSLKSDSSSGFCLNITITDAEGRKVVFMSRHAWDPEAPSKPEFEAKAKAIVHRVNTHDQLLAALEASLSYARHEDNCACFAGLGPQFKCDCGYAEFADLRTAALAAAKG